MKGQVVEKVHENFEDVFLASVAPPTRNMFPNKEICGKVSLYKKRYCRIDIKEHGSLTYYEN